MLSKLVICILFATQLDAECCPSRRYSFNKLMCGDNTPLGDSYYCGYGKCNIFGCDCIGGCRKPTGMVFKAGDAIACYMSSSRKKTFDVPPWHVMLALNNKEVMHVANVNDTDIFNKGAVIKRESFQYALQHGNDGKGYDHCQLVNDFINETIYHYDKILPLSVEDTITKALRDENRTIEYNVIFKNCEHWVTYWMYDVKKGLSLQLGNKFNKFAFDTITKPLMDMKYDPDPKSLYLHR